MLPLAATALFQIKEIRLFFFFSASYGLVDIDTELAKVDLGLVNLLHQLLVCIGNIVESKDAETEAEEEEGAKGDEGPEGKLFEVCILV